MLLGVFHGPIKHSEPTLLKSLEEELSDRVPVRHFKHTKRRGKEFRNYLRHSLYPGYYSRNSVEKHFEHWVSFTLLGMDATTGKSHLDLGSASSLAAVFNAQRLYGHKSVGVDARRVAPICPAQYYRGRFERLPFPSNRFDFVTAHCTWEHIRRDGDIEALREIERVLNAGGRACIVPFYLYSRHSIQCPPEDVGDIDQGSSVFVAHNMSWGRFYGPESFQERILNNVGSLHPELVRVHHESFAPNLYTNWALLLHKE